MFLKFENNPGTQVCNQEMLGFLAACFSFLLFETTKKIHYVRFLKLVFRLSIKCLFKKLISNSTLKKRFFLINFIFKTFTRDIQLENKKELNRVSVEGLFVSQTKS